MKNILYLLMLLPLALLGGCNDDDDLPEVQIYTELGNVVYHNDVAFVVKDTPLEITSISVKGVGSPALITSVSYYWDGYRLGWNNLAPFSVTIPAALMTEGHHTLGITAEVAQEGKSLGIVATNYMVNAVASEADLPETPDIPDNSDNPTNPDTPGTPE